MNNAILLLLFCCTANLLAQVRNPIMFVTAVPTPSSIICQSAPFGSQSTDPNAAPRGGDLMIVYHDGSLRNLTREAGFGAPGFQGQKGWTAIAVREPNVHWSGNKAVFSMLTGAPMHPADTRPFFWQLYEVSGLGKNDKAAITKVPNQPENFNNISPIYGTDDKIIFVSDRTPNGDQGIFPTFDEANADATNTGVWSLDPVDGTLKHLDHSPSGSFSPQIDSYGRIIFTRWDHLTYDQDSIVDAQNKILKPFNFSSEASDASPAYNNSSQFAPEASPFNRTLLQGSNSNPHSFTLFMPWTMNQDGSNAQTINHVGRHDLRDTMVKVFKDDPNLVAFTDKTSNRPNKNVVFNFYNIKPDNMMSGVYYAIDGEIPGRSAGYSPSNNTHSAGQVVKIEAPPNALPEDIKITYLTSRYTHTPFQPTTMAQQLDSARHTGFYRNPLPTTDGRIVVSHTGARVGDSNQGISSNTAGVDSVVKPLFDFRLKILDRIDVTTDTMKAATVLTQGIRGVVQWWDGNIYKKFDGNLWELDPVEIVTRPRPHASVAKVAATEQDVFSEEGVDSKVFEKYLTNTNQALLVMRDITDRNKDDKQQPFNLRVSGTKKVSPNATGKIYDVSHIQFMQGEHIRGYNIKTVTNTPSPVNGRRALPVPLHEVKYTNDASAPAGATRISPDGSIAALVPAGRATTWHLMDEQGKPVVRERYWVTFKSGEIRTCTSCHGSNGDAPDAQALAPKNKPEALRGILQAWKSDYTPGVQQLTSPLNNSSDLKLPVTLQWQETSRAFEYEITLSSVINGNTTTIYTRRVKETSIKISQSDLSGFSNSLSWSVKPIGEYVTGVPSETWNLNVVPQVSLLQPSNAKTGVAEQPTILWNTAPGALSYNVQLSASKDFSSLLVDAKNYNDMNMLLPTLDFNTTYYWRVQAVLQSGVSGWSTIWSFTVREQSSLSSSTLVFPVNNQQDVPAASVNLVWTESSGASKYVVSISELESFGAAMEKQTSGTTFTISDLKEGTTYYWRVKAANDVANSDWSEVWSFKTHQAVTSGVADNSNQVAMKIYPQPATHSVTVTFDLNEAHGYTIGVIDLMGRMVLSLNSDAASSTVTEVLPLNALSAGNYTVVMNAGSYYSRQRLSVVK